MKSFSRVSTFALLLCLTLAGVTASAKVKSRTVAVSQEFTVGGTVIKSGIYLFRFDDKTNELTIADNAKRSRIIARVSARASARESAASRVSARAETRAMMTSRLALSAMVSSLVLSSNLKR